MVRLGRINAAGLDTNRNGCRRMNVSTAKRSRVNIDSRIIWAIPNCGKRTNRPQLIYRPIPKKRRPRLAQL